jgi:hypothetical protein
MDNNAGAGAAHKRSRRAEKLGLGVFVYALHKKYDLFNDINVQNQRENTLPKLESRVLTLKWWSGQFNGSR